MVVTFWALRRYTSNKQMRVAMKPFLLLAGLISSLAAPAQVRHEIDKAKGDPQTAEKAARADVRLIDLKTVTPTHEPTSSNDNSQQKQPRRKTTQKKKS
jgi:hypothetical protein